MQCIVKIVTEGYGVDRLVRMESQYPFERER